MSNALPDQDVPSQVDDAGKAPKLGETSAFTLTEGGVTFPVQSVDDPLIGTSIGRYRLLKKLGEGGMGSVYLAEQSEPVKRQVALKLIRGNVDSRTILARFEAERQALAVMDHPNIARIYDGGTTSTHHPFFVMELVLGVPITEYCDQHRLSPKQRLELFVPICQAVQHAHQKGIIHRDLKPSNVLVTEVDGLPVPKVIDFGVAKATEQPLTDQSLGDTGAIVGTPTYMSPEQADPGSMDIDTRTDIYALGAMLYELLTGSTPIDARQFRRGALLEVLRMVREVEPQRPSTKLSTAEALPSIAANRSMEPKQLQAMLRNDIDWIVMKAIEKDRNRRYETANGFAADVQRYLTGEAVLAHPPSRWYLVKKFVLRNRGQVVAAGLVVSALVAGLAVSLWQMNRAMVAEGLAKTNEDKALKAADKEKTANELTTLRLEQIVKINNSVFDIFTEFDIRKLKNGPDPVEYVLAQKLIEAGKKLDTTAIHDPLVLANLQYRLGQSLISLGESKAAIEYLLSSREARQARLGIDHPDTLTSMHYLAEAYQNAGKLNLAVQLFEETLKFRKVKLGPVHSNTLTTMSNLAGAYQVAGKRNLALPLMEETLKLQKANLGTDHLNTLISMSNLAAIYMDAGELERALPLLKESLKLRKAKLGDSHPDTLISMNNMAVGYENASKIELALPLYQETLRLKKAKLGTDHPSTLVSMNNLARAYQIAGKLDLTLTLMEETLKLKKTKLGADHPETLMSMNNLAFAYHAAKKQAMSLQLFEETLKLRKVKLGTDHTDTHLSMSNLAAGYYAAGKLDLALPLWEESLKLTKAKQGADHPSTISCLGDLGFGYFSAGKLDLALPLFQEAALGLEKRSFQHEDARLLVNNLINCHERLKQYDHAEVWRRKWLAVVKERAGTESSASAEELSALGLNLLLQKKWLDAEPIFRECLAIREKKEQDIWTTFNTKSMLGGVLLGQKKYADAEPLLLKGYAGMKLRESTIPALGNPRLPEAIDRLIQLYTETNKPEEVKKWQSEKAKYPEAKSTSSQKAP